MEADLLRQLLDYRALERSSIVANSTMNRDRGIAGINSYAKELGFNPCEFLTRRICSGSSAKWLDLCCGTGRGLIEAAEYFNHLGLTDRVHLVGVDLVAMFRPLPPGLRTVQLHAASLHDWSTQDTFDLVTCVHGLHYIGDKLGLISRALSWLASDGRFVAHLDLENVSTIHETSKRKLTGYFKRCGITYNRRRRIVDCTGRRTVLLPYEYLGADDRAGPKCTRQPAVNSYYREARS